MPWRRAQERDAAYFGPLRWGVITKRIVLVGGGLAHLHCLRALRDERVGGAQIVLVSPSAEVVYSGMVPGWLAGHYAMDECVVAVDALARAAGATFVNATVMSVDPIRRQVRCDDGSEHAYDLLSLDVGSAIDASQLAGTQAHGIAVRPLERFAARWSDARSRIERHGRGNVVVVGAGAGGVELALGARHGLPFRDVSVAIVAATQRLPGRSGPRLERRLRAAGIAMHRPRTAVRIGEDFVELADGTRLAADATIVATGSAAPRWLAASGLTVDSDGYVVIDPTLRVVSHPEVFASGDCASMSSCPQPKSGVHALRMGPTLLQNLRRSLEGRPLMRHVPRERALHLMSTGDRYAVGAWGRVSFEGRWVWRWKDRIDRAFVARHSPHGGVAR